MKNKTIIIVTVILFLFTLAACDSLIAPIKERLNPLDPQNPVPAAENFNTAIAYDSADETKMVELTWQEGAYEGDYHLEGYIIISSLDATPETIWDGALVALLYKDQGLSYQHRVGENPEYFFGNTVYYSIFSFGSREGDMNEEDRINSDENNNLVNTENYDITGPVSSEIDVWNFADMPVTVDKYMMDNGLNEWYDGDDITITVNSGAPYTIAGINFDLTDPPSGEVQLVQLILTKYGDNANGDGNIELATWDDDWTAATMWTMITTYTVGNTQGVAVPNSADAVIEVDVTDIYSDWIDSTMDNNGFSLRSYDATNGFPFASSLNDDTGPKLRVHYMND